MNHKPQHRRGTLYLAILGVSTIVSVLALAGMHAARSHLWASTQNADRARARLLAQSAIELGIIRINDNPSWRTVFSVETDYPVTPVSTGGGSFTWRLHSAGGLNRTLSGTGVVGEVTCTLTVDLAQPPDLDCALLAEGDIIVDSGCTLTAEDAPIATNGDFDNQGATYADAEAQSFTGSSINGTTSAPAPLRVLPSISMALDYYQSQGTELQTGMFGLVMTTLSPNSSWGDTNDDGIYIIDPQTYDLSISSSRIVGTLVVPRLDPGKKVIISSYVNWEPAYPNYPALIVDGDLEIRIRDGELSEWFLSPSYNPAGTPYQGEEDSDQDDSFASSIAGLVYCTGDLTIVGNGSDDWLPDLRGIFLVGGQVRVEAQMLPTFKYDAAPALAPPPGFDLTDPVVIVPGSWR